MNRLHNPGSTLQAAPAAESCGRVCFVLDPSPLLTSVSSAVKGLLGLTAQTEN
ncbi:MAG: hypothetical protein IJ573_00800 [Clostridia bacterium]|nr:hypothetical protein [Clostridia bacterium]